MHWQTRAEVSRFMVKLSQNKGPFLQRRMILLLAFFISTHILLAVLIGNSVVLAPDEGGYAYTFKNIYGGSEDPNPQFSSGWISAPKIFLFLVYLPAKVFSIFGVSDLLSIRLLSIMLSALVMYGIIYLASRNPEKKPDKFIVLSLGVFLIPSIFLWTTVGLREAFIVWALFICFFGLFRFFSSQSFLNLVTISFGYYCLLSIKSYLWAGAVLALVSLFPSAFFKKISIKNLLSIIVSAAVAPAILFSVTSTPYALNFIINPDFSSAANRSGDSVNILYINEKTGNLETKKSNENDKEVFLHGDYTALSLNEFIHSNPDTIQSKILKFVGFDGSIQNYVQSKVTSSTSKPESGTIPGPITISSDKSVPGHIITPGNLSNPASLIKPSLLFALGNVPFSQNGENLFRTIASFESPLWWIFYTIVLFALLGYRKKNWLENPILIYSSFLTFTFILMSALTEVNFGTSFRHRSILVIPIVFILISVRISLQKESESNYPGQDIKVDC